MGRRRSVTTIKAIAGGDHEPITCFCGAADFEHSWTRFPMRHVSRCVACGFTLSVDLKIEPPRRAGPPSEPYHFDENGFWD